MRKDGTQVTQITSDTTQGLYVVGDWIYYNSWSYTTDICRIKLDGSHKETLYSGQYDSLSTDGKHLYFSDFAEDIYIKAPMDGGAYEVLVDNQWGVMPQIASEWVYYMDGNTYDFMRIKKDGTEKEKCTLRPLINYITNDEYLYIGSKKQNIETGEEIIWTDYNYSKIQLVGNEVLVWVNEFKDDDPSKKLLSSSLLLIKEDEKEHVLEYMTFIKH